MEINSAFTYLKVKSAKCLCLLSVVLVLVLFTSLSTIPIPELGFREAVKTYSDPTTYFQGVKTPNLQELPVVKVVM